MSIVTWWQRIQDEWVPENWRNCSNCNWALVRFGPPGPKAERSMRKHLGHRCYSATHFTMKEWFMVVLGLL